MHSGAHLRHTALLDILAYSHCSLVFNDCERKVGMQVGGGRCLQALLSPKVALLSAIAGSIAVASCVLNDFFDYSVDVINEPSKVSHSPCLLLAPALPCNTILLSVKRRMTCHVSHAICKHATLQVHLLTHKDDSSSEGR